RHHRLTAIRVADLPSELAPPPHEFLPDRVVEIEWQLEQRRDRVASEVVVGWSESATRDHDTGAIKCTADCVLDLRDAVTDGGAAFDAHADLRQCPAGECDVAVDGVTEQQLG